MNESKMNESEIHQLVDLLWEMGMATKLDFTYRKIASALAEKVANDPEQATLLIAALLQTYDETGLE